MTNEAMAPAVKWRRRFYQIFAFGSALILNAAFVIHRLLQAKPISWAAPDHGKIWPFLFMSIACTAVYFVYKALLLKDVRIKSITPVDGALKNDVMSIFMLWFALMSATIGFDIRGSLIILLVGWGFPVVAFVIGRRTKMDKEIRAYYEH